MLKRTKKGEIKQSIGWNPKIYSVVETDNFGGDYPNESFLIRHISQKCAKQIAEIVNNEMDAGKGGSRFWKVVEDTYKNPYQLRPGFEP